MKTNITLLTTTARARRAGVRPAERPAGPSEAVMGIPGTRGPDERGHSAGARDGCALSNRPPRGATARPARLADGLGLESTPGRHRRPCAPESDPTDSLGPPLPRRAARD